MLRYTNIVKISYIHNSHVSYLFLAVCHLFVNFAASFFTENSIMAVALKIITGNLKMMVSNLKMMMSDLNIIFKSCLFLVFVPHIIPPQVQSYPYHYVRNQHHRVIDIGHQQDVDHTERAGHAQQCEHGLPRGQPDGKEFMVDVVLVRFKRVPAFAYTYHDYPDNIEGGNDQGTEGYDKSAFGIRGDIRIDLAVFDGKETQRITQGKAAGVPHENLPGTLGAAEHVVIEERDKDTESGDGKHGIAPQALVDEEKSEDEQGNAAQAGGKPVNAVYQVDGIGDENYGEDGERHADAGGQRMDAEQAV